MKTKASKVEPQPLKYVHIRGEGGEGYSLTDDVMAHYGENPNQSVVVVVVAVAVATTTDNTTATITTKKVHL